MFGSLRRVYNTVLGHSPYGLTQQEAMDRLESIQFPKKVNFNPFPTTMADIALSTDDPKVKIEAIRGYGYFAPHTGSSKVAAIATHSANPDVQKAAVSTAILGSNYWFTRPLVKEILDHSKNPDVGMTVLDSINQAVDVRKAKGYVFDEYGLEELKGMTIDVLSSFNGIDKVESRGFETHRRLGQLEPNRRIEPPTLG